jgi:hypothetical protein
MHELCASSLTRNFPMRLPAGCAQGHQADHVLEIGLAQGKDTLIWHHAHEHNAVVMTKDEDFAERVRDVAARVLWSSGCASATVPTGHCAHGLSRCCPPL